MLSGVRRVPMGLPLRVFYWKLDQGSGGLEIPVLSWSEQGRLITPSMTGFFEVWSCCGITLWLRRKLFPNIQAWWSALGPYLLFTLSEPSRGPTISPLPKPKPFLTQGRARKPGVCGKERIMEEGEGGSYESTTPARARRSTLGDFLPITGSGIRGQPCPGEEDSAARAQHFVMTPAGGGLGSATAAPHGQTRFMWSRKREPHIGNRA